MTNTRIAITLLALSLLALGAFDPAAAQDLGERIGGELNDRTISVYNPLTGEGITVTLLRVVYVVGGGLLLFAGWWSWRVAIGIAGFMIGSSLGYSIAGPDAALLLALVVSMLGGVLGALLATFATLVAVGIIGLYVGFVAVVALLRMFGLADELSLSTLRLTVVFGSVAGALAAALLARELIIILTSLYGAITLTQGLGLADTGLSALVMLALFVIGLSVQGVAVRRRRRRA